MRYSTVFDLLEDNYLGDYYVGQTIGEIWGLTNDGYFLTDEEAEHGALLETSSNKAYASAGCINMIDFTKTLIY